MSFIASHQLLAQPSAVVVTHFRYWRAHWTAGGGDTYHAIGDLRFRLSAVKQHADMTSNTAPIPYVTSATYEQAGSEAYLAADASLTTGWLGVGAQGQPDSYWTLDAGAGNEFTMDDYQITSLSGGQEGYAPTAWTIAASNTGAFGGEEHVWDTRSGISWSAAQTQTFTPQTPPS